MISLGHGDRQQFLQVTTLVSILLELRVRANSCHNYGFLLLWLDLPLFPSDLAQESALGETSFKRRDPEEGALDPGVPIEDMTLEDRHQEEGKGWQCERCNCGALNNSNHRCRCQKAKPSTYPSEQLSTTEWSSETSLTCVDGITSTSSACDVIPPVTSSSTTYESSPGGTRPKYRYHQGGARDPGVPIKDMALEDGPQEDVLDFPVPECRIVLIGKTGNGKSSTGNTILNLTGNECFLAAQKMSSVTKKCQSKHKTCFGINILVVDTPGLFEPCTSQADLYREISRCMGMASPGPHVLLMVMRLDVRFTNEEAECLQGLKELFGDDIISHVIAVFTHGEVIDSNTTESDFIAENIRNSQQLLQDFFKEIDNRYVVINNKTENQEEQYAQVRKLLIKIREMLALYDNLHFNNDLLKECEAVVLRKQEELVRMLESDANTSAEARKLVRETMGSQKKMDRMVRSKLSRENLDLRNKESSMNIILELREKMIKEIEQKLKQEVKIRIESQLAKQLLMDKLNKIRKKLDNEQNKAMESEKRQERLKAEVTKTKEKLYKMAKEGEQAIQTLKEELEQKEKTLEEEQEKTKQSETKQKCLLNELKENKEKLDKIENEKKPKNRCSVM